MTKYICDRCGAESNASFQRLVLHELNGFHCGYDKDLCQSCLEQLKEWLKPLPKPAEKEK